MYITMAEAVYNAPGYGLNTEWRGKLELIRESFDYTRYLLYLAGNPL